MCHWQWHGSNRKHFRWNRLISIKASTKELIEPWFRIKSCAVIMYHSGSIKTEWAKVLWEKFSIGKSLKQSTEWLSEKVPGCISLHTHPGNPTSEVASGITEIAVEIILGRFLPEGWDTLFGLWPAYLGSCILWCN